MRRRDAIAIGWLMGLAAGTLMAATESTFAAVRYVKWDASGASNGTSRTDAYTSLQSALAAAVSGDEIWVAAGTYTLASPGGDCTATFQLKGGVAIYVRFPGLAGQRGSFLAHDWQTNVTTLTIRGVHAFASVQLARRGLDDTRQGSAASDDGRCGVGRLAEQDRYESQRLSRRSSRRLHGGHWGDCWRRAGGFCFIR